MNTHKVPKVLTIAGSDSSCGAGIQADIKTISALGAYGTCAITAITAQNTLGIRSTFEIPAGIVGQQIDAIVTDISADAVKTGMLVNESIVEVVCDKVKKYNLNKLVIDPIIKSHSGESLLTSEGVKKLCTKLIPISHLVTPNIPEAETLAKRKINNMNAVKDAAKAIYELGAENVLIKGGHINNHENEVVDILYDGKTFEYFREKWIKTDNVHGTGCVYSAAIAAELAKGNDLTNSIRNAKIFLNKTIKSALKLGKGHKLASF